MLSGKENEVMSAIYSLCDGTEGCLASSRDIFTVMPSKRHVSEENLENIIESLRCDGYFEVVTSDRKGEKVYVITLKERGFAYRRDAIQKQRDVTFKIFLAFIGACATFIFGFILRHLFGN